MVPVDLALERESLGDRAHRVQVVGEHPSVVAEAVAQRLLGLLPDRVHSGTLSSRTLPLARIV